MNKLFQNVIVVLMVVSMLFTGCTNPMRAKNVMEAMSYESKLAYCRYSAGQHLERLDVSLISEKLNNIKNTLYTRDGSDIAQYILENLGIFIDIELKEAIKHEFIRMNGFDEEIIFYPFIDNNTPMNEIQHLIEMINIAIDTHSDIIVKEHIDSIINDENLSEGYKIVLTVLSEIIESRQNSHNECTGSRMSLEVFICCLILIMILSSMDDEPPAAG